MYKLFWDPGSANMAPHAALEEIGCPYELVKVDIQKGEQRPPAYLKLNPNARVPTLVDGDKAMFESAAIVLYLAEKHPEAKLMPPPGAPERMKFLQWLMYLTNTIQDSFILYYHPDNFFPDEPSRAALKAAGEARLEKQWSVVDAALAENGPYLTGATFSAADLYLHMLARWSRNCARPASRYPSIARQLDLVRPRPAVRRMMAQEGLAESF
ncbi:MAG: glutathione S-transferase N-terminal domain-containing protein [Alphaproteobacteria bacterium]|nr:glutathione S-transferase N-terminal domain-containing protein [Alphaproteobacteria bacterium]